LAGETTDFRPKTSNNQRFLQRSIFSDFWGFFSDFSEIDFWRSICGYPSYVELFGLEFTVISSSFHSFTVSQFHKTGMGGGVESSFQSSRCDCGSRCFLGLEACPQLLLFDHGTSMRRKAKMIGKVRESFLRSVFRGLRREGAGYGLDECGSPGP